MSFDYRLQILKEQKQYSEQLLSQITQLSDGNGGRLPKQFYLGNVGKATIEKIIKDLGYKNRPDITAPYGATNPVRKIVLR